MSDKDENGIEEEIDRDDIGMWMGDRDGNGDRDRDRNKK
jgi:hypothetical protein